MIVLIHDGERIQLVIPDDVVGLLEGGAQRRGHQLLTGRHEGGDLLIAAHAGNAVVTTGDDTQQLTIGLGILGDGHGGEAELLLQLQHIGEGVVGGQIGLADHETGLVALDAAHHLGLRLNRLRAEDEGDAALLGKGDGQRVVGHGLHHGRDHGDIEGDGALLLTLAVLHQRGLERHGIGYAVLIGVTGHQQILAESMGRFGIIESHRYLPLI